MSTANPTALRPGMKGRLLGQDYVIRGRITYSTDVGGERYYWQEFFLGAPDGGEATLVYEETERGAEWRLFYYFEPKSPLSVIDASRVMQNDVVKVDEFSGMVELTGQCRVREIEGEAPRGLCRGELSSYFNAGAGGKMLVVSWTNRKVEHYLGQTIGRNFVQEAFGAAELPGRTKRHKPLFGALLGGALLGRDDESGGGPNIDKMVGYLVAAVVALMVVMGFLPSCERNEKFPVRDVPPARLAAGQTVHVQNDAHRVADAAEVEYCTVSGVYLGRIYGLTDPSGARSHLCQGISPKFGQWLFVNGAMLGPVAGLRPQQLGGLKLGQAVMMDGREWRITQLFRLRILKSDVVNADRLLASTRQHGFMAVAGGQQYLFIWNENEARCGPCFHLDDFNP